MPRALHVLHALLPNPESFHGRFLALPEFKWEEIVGEHFDELDRRYAKKIRTQQVASTTAVVLKTRERNGKEAQVFVYFSDSGPELMRSLPDESTQSFRTKSRNQS
jgi:hypothetical protein